MAFGQDSIRNANWNDGTAMTYRAHRIELDLFQLSGYGISNRVSIYAHPLMVWLLPQIKVKVGWAIKKRIVIASEHELLYPTFFLSVVSRKGTGGLVSPEYHYPQMFSFYNAVLASWSPFPRALITAKAGITFAVKFGPLDPNSTIDFPVIYPILAPFYSTPEFIPGMDFRGRFYKFLGWQMNAECYILTSKENNFFFQNKGVLTYHSKRGNLKVEAGFKLCFGEYPYGNQWDLLPAVDVAFGIR
jgi:hypothetical protein